MGPKGYGGSGILFIRLHSPAEAGRDFDFGVLPSDFSAGFCDSFCSMGISSVPAEDLATNPWDHKRVACLVAGVLWMVKKTIFVRGEMRRIS